VPEFAPTLRGQSGSAPRILAIANQKGGVGKTTTAINLATALANTGHSVLLVDLDPQGNASTGVGIDYRSRASGTYAMLIEGAAPELLIARSGIDRLDVIPADSDLAGAEVELVSLDQREFRLKNALRTLLPRGYSHIVIDCPPSLGLLTLNGLVAATSVLVPLQCEFFALEGISQLVRTIDRVKRSLNPSLTLQGIVLTMFDRRNNLSDLVAADARSFFGDRVYDTVIPRNVRVSEAPSHGKPVLLYDKNSPGALAYVRLADELLRRDGAVAA
jgi:chromosome partitioning protein